MESLADEGSIRMTEQLDQQQLKRVVQMVADEILDYLHVPGTGTDVVHAAAPELAEKPATAAGTHVDSHIGDTDIAANIAAMIDHTLLCADASRADIQKLCAEAIQFSFATVCVHPWYVPLAVEALRGSHVYVCTVVGFPLGATLPAVKIYEAEQAIKLGALEIDMVQNIGAFKSGLDDQVEAEIRGVVDVCHRGGAICKVILETALLDSDEIVRAAQLAQRAGADFVKTSTGFAARGATAADVAAIRAAVGNETGVKAAGGIRTLEDLQKMVAAGATRIGTSAGVAILEQSSRSVAARDAATLPRRDVARVVAPIERS
jgi:deoxyribose-phosphate aldolase